MTGKLALALLLGGMVGLERERRDRPAGIRTHMIVCVGSTLIALVSIAMAGAHADQTRIAAQIVSGIGFLGAGTIFRSGVAVRGLTTAAGLWVIAGIGMGVAVGGNMQVLACITALLVFATNMWVRPLEDRLIRPRRDLLVRLKREPGFIARVLTQLETHGVRLESVELIEVDTIPPIEQLVRFRVHLPPNGELAPLLAQVAELDGVHEVSVG